MGINIIKTRPALLKGKFTQTTEMTQRRTLDYNSRLNGAVIELNRRKCCFFFFLNIISQVVVCGGEGTDKRGKAPTSWIFLSHLTCEWRGIFPPGRVYTVQFQWSAMLIGFLLSYFQVCLGVKEKAIERTKELNHSPNVSSFFLSFLLSVSSRVRNCWYRAPPRSSSIDRYCVYIYIAWHYRDVEKRRGARGDVQYIF